MGQEGIEEGREDDVSMVGGSHWCKHKREGVGCILAQTELPWLGWALGVVNGGKVQSGTSSKQTEINGKGQYREPDMAIG